MLKRMIALLAITSLSFAVSCSSDTSVSSLSGSGLSDIILDDEGNVIDEEPADENENIDEIIENEDIVDEEPAGEEESEEEEEIDVVVDDPVEEEEEEDIDLPVDPPVCVMRKSLRIEKLDGSGSIGDISSYKGYLSAAMNYNYYSASAHPIVGPHPEEYEGHFFFYEGKEGLALNFFYNIDAGGSSNNQVKMEVSVHGNDQIDKVLLSDDGNEVKKSSSADGVNIYSGKMHYWFNTDGGVIGPLKGDDFKIHVKIFNVGDNKTVGFHSSNGESLALQTGVSAAEAYSEFVIYYAGEVEDCDLDKIDDSRNQCVKEIADKYEDEIKESEMWREKYSQALKDRKTKVKEMALDHKKERESIKAEFKEILARLRAEHKAARADLNSSIKAKMKACRSDKEARKSGECKKLAVEMRAERKSLKDSHRSAYKAILDQRKAALKAFASDCKAKRKDLAQSLLKAAKALRHELRSAHNKMMQGFQEDIASCDASE